MRIVLIQNDVNLRNGLKVILESEPDIQVVGEFNRVVESLASIQAMDADLLMMDLADPEGTGIGLLPTVRQLAPSTRTLVLTGHESEERIHGALGAGADGYLSKGASRAELMRAIRTVAHGANFLCGMLARQLLLGSRTGGTAFEPLQAASAAAQSITGREREVLTRIAAGSSTKQIAIALCLSPKTIEKHRSNIMKKLHLHNAAALTMFAFANGLADTLNG
jgi:two-component system response regulator NreC